MTSFRFLVRGDSLEEVIVQSQLSQEQLVIVQEIYDVITDESFTEAWSEFSGPLRVYFLEINIPFGKHLERPIEELYCKFKKGRDFLKEDYTQAVVIERQPEYKETLHKLTRLYDDLLDGS